MSYHITIVIIILCLNQAFAVPFFWGGIPSVPLPSRTMPSVPLPTNSPKPTRTTNPTANLPKPVPAVPSVQIPTFTGRMTYYGVDGEPGPNKAYGACGFAPNTVSDNFVAINGAQYTAKDCGKCISVNYQDKCAEAVRVDLCPSCPFGGIDVALDIFATLVGSEAEARRRGFVPDVKWHWVECGTGCGGS